MIQNISDDFYKFDSRHKALSFAQSWSNNENCYIAVIDSFNAVADAHTYFIEKSVGILRNGEKLIAEFENGFNLTKGSY
ncbi:MAG: hypothetical protein KJ799_12845 [Bacteroidetes bacterium]|nr:hypothetical protein [Bacteroidota bacterium]